MLARDLLVCGQDAELLDHVTLLIVPIFSPDGYERFGPYNRLNQNGPREQGWRVTAANYNLNRDFTKADAVEMRAFLRLWNAWRPDIFYDDHTTDGSDHRYTIMYSGTTEPATAAGIRAWTRDVLYPRLWPALEARGWGCVPYSSPRDAADESKGIRTSGAYGARYSTGFGAACNRVTLLVETHALKPYAERVHATYDLLWETLRTLDAEHASLRMAVRQADAESVRDRGAVADGRIPLKLTSGPTHHPFVYKGYVTRQRASDISGVPVIEYTDMPVDVPTQLFDEHIVEEAIVPPAAYLIPPQWTDVIDRLHWQGIEMRRLATPCKLAITSYRFESVTFPPRPYEGRFLARYEARAMSEEREFPAGTVVVDMRQVRAALAANLLEPDAPDSLVAWGFFNAIFEVKEYFEAYAMEPLAQKMLAADPQLAAAFQQRLTTDSNFAADPEARLNFFYERSPYYDRQAYIYPLARLENEAVLGKLKLRD